MSKCVALIVAAGRGHRFGGEIPKQYRTINNKMILSRTIAIFCAHPAISAVKVVIHPDDLPLYRCATENLSILEPTFGGETRQDSVRLGLEGLADEKPDIVLIHDAARPFVNFDTINRVIQNTTENQGAIPAIPVVDTIKTISLQDGKRVITSTIDRNKLWRVQTPQAFPFKKILEAHQSLVGQELTDDASIAEKTGIQTILIDGFEDNFKITTQEDLIRANNLLKFKENDIRTATGFDVHQFCEGTFCYLCGVKVPHDFGLKGHSDADVGLHALTDALLGTISSGDIGLHFPPSDQKWKGADSTIFLKHAVQLIEGLDGEILNADITFICERPKIGKYRLDMMERLSSLLHISSNKISIKATTTEQLGFTGRKEGLACQACATVRF